MTGSSPHEIPRSLNARHAQQRSGTLPPPPAYSSLFPDRSVFMPHHQTTPEGSGYNAYAQESASNDATQKTTSDRNRAWMQVMMMLFFIATAIGVIVFALFLGSSKSRLVTYERLGMAVRWNICRDIELATCQELIRAGKGQLVRDIPEEAWNHLKHRFERAVIAA